MFYWLTCGSQQCQSTLVQLKYFGSFNPNQWDGGNEPHGIHFGRCQRHDSQYCVVIAKETNVMAMTNDQTYGRFGPKKQHTSLLLHFPSDGFGKSIFGLPYIF